MTNTVLVLGARGRLGGAVAQAFAVAGWRVLAQRRSAGKAPADADGIEWVQVEAGDTAALLRARNRRPGGGARDEPGLHGRRLARTGAGPDAGDHRCDGRAGGGAAVPGQCLQLWRGYAHGART
ncbi:MAG: hypothetical protein IPH15_13265 [Comamonadaceae bacterium]|nr:hypothetical protein [Comamonadaceae bacterium]